MPGVITDSCSESENELLLLNGNDVAVGQTLNVSQKRKSTKQMTFDSKSSPTLSDLFCCPNQKLHSTQ